MGQAVNGWHIPQDEYRRFRDGLRHAGLHRLDRLGANLPEDALYPTTFVDGDGKLLNGANRYSLHFEAGLTPPVNAFWSVTMYDPQSFFVGKSDPSLCDRRLDAAKAKQRRLIGHLCSARLAGRG